MFSLSISNYGITVQYQINTVLFQRCLKNLRNIWQDNLVEKCKVLLFLQDAEIKLTDFGFAKVDDGNLQTPHFTPYYVAPQVFNINPFFFIVFIHSLSIS